MCSEQGLNIGVCLADYLKKLKEEEPDYQLGAVSLNVSFKNNGSEYMTYSISGDPLLSDEVMATVCEEDLKNSVVIPTEDDPVLVTVTVAMISKLTNGQISFTDVIYVPEAVSSEEVEVRNVEHCCNHQQCCKKPEKTPDEDFSMAYEDMRRILGELDDLQKRCSYLKVFPFLMNPFHAECRCKRNKFFGEL